MIARVPPSLLILLLRQRPLLLHILDVLFVLLCRFGALCRPLTVELIRGALSGHVGPAIVRHIALVLCLRLACIRRRRKMAGFTDRRCNHLCRIGRLVGHLVAFRHLL